MTAKELSQAALAWMAIIAFVFVLMVVGTIRMAWDQWCLFVQRVNGDLVNIRDDFPVVSRKRALVFGGIALSVAAFCWFSTFYR